jgi:Chaperone of endosialidase
MGTPTLQRPLKTNNTRTYVDEVTSVAPADAPILAPEVDADLDTLYNAWNNPASAFPPTGPAGGSVLAGTYPNPTLAANAVWTANILDLAVTDAKITSVAWAKVTGAPTIPTTLPPSGPASGDLTGTYPAPTLVAAQKNLWQDSGTVLQPVTLTGRVLSVPGTLAIPGAAGALFAGAIFGGATAKGRLTSQLASGALSTFSLNVNRDLSNSNAQDDPSRPSWGLTLRLDNDVFQVQRSPAGSTTQTNVFQVSGGAAAVLNGPSDGSLTPSLTLNGWSTSGGFDPSIGINKARAGNAAILAGDFLGNFSVSPWNGSAYGRTGTFGFAASENHSTSAGGTDCYLWATPNGSRSQSVAFGFNHDGSATKPGGGSWTAASDARVKKTSIPYATGLAAILQLEPIAYQYNGLAGTSDDGKTYHGFVAQDVLPIMPEMVGIVSQKLHPDDPEPTELYVVNNSPLTFALVNAVKELAARVTALEGAAA